MRPMILILAGVAAFSAAVSPTFSSSPSLSENTPAAEENYGQWGRYREISLNTSPTGADVATDQVGFPVLVSLSAQQADVFASAAPAGADIRFSTAEGRHLAYQIESWDGAAQKAAIWVRVDTIKGGSVSQRLRMHWAKPGAADSSDGKSVFRNGDGFRGVWHLGTAEDATANANHGKDSGTAAAEGRIGGGRYFDNPDAYAKSGKYIALGNPPGLDITGKATFEAWVKWTRRDGHRIIICHGSAPGSDFETVLRIGETRDYRAGVWTGSSHYAALTAPAADSNAWVHLAGVYSGSGWILYRNGKKAAETPADSNGAKPSSGGWRIGAEFASNSVTRYFHGWLDEVRVSNAARSADWIKLGYESQKDGQAAVSLGQTVTALAPSAAAGARGRPALGTLRGRRLYRMPSPSDHSIDATGSGSAAPGKPDRSMEARSGN